MQSAIWTLANYIYIYIYIFLKQLCTFFNLNLFIILRIKNIAIKK